MKRIDRLKEIEQLWESAERIDPWEEIKWEPSSVNADPYMLNDERVAKQIESEGYYFWKWGFREEASVHEWEWLLLQHLYTWCCLPEGCEAPLFVDESARVVCIPDPQFVNDLESLFRNPNSMLLGMENLRAVRVAQCAADEAIMAASRANPENQVLKREAIRAFLNQ